MRERLGDLPAIEAAVWRELQRAAADRHHAWRTPVLATADAQGEPDARTVVLREVQMDDRRLAVYTDRRSGKVAQLQARPRAVLAMWSPALGWQLRIRAAASLHLQGLAASSRWARVKQSPAAHDYLSPLPPGSDLEAGEPPGGPPADPQPPARSLPIDHTAFAVVELQVLAIDWLELHPQGHRRAVFSPARTGWLQP